MKQELLTPEQLREEQRVMEMVTLNAQRRRHEEAAEFTHRQTIRTRLAYNTFLCCMGMAALALTNALVFVIWRFILRT